METWVASRRFADPMRTFQELPDPAVAPEVVLTMGIGADRGALREVLAEAGWSVTLIDDGWTLLDHLGGARLASVTSPVMVVLQIAAPGPRLGEVMARVRGLFPDLPVLLVGAEADGHRSLLRPPFGAERVLRAVRRLVGTVRRW